MSKAGSDGMDYDRQFQEDLEKAQALSLETLALEKFRMEKMRMELHRLQGRSDTGKPFLLVLETLFGYITKCNKNLKNNFVYNLCYQTKLNYSKYSKL